MNTDKYEKEDVAMMPFFVHESEMWRLEHVIRRLTWICAGGWIVSALCVLAYFLK